MQHKGSLSGRPCKLMMLVKLCVCHGRLTSAGPTLSAAASHKAALLWQTDRAHIEVPTHILPSAS